MTSKKGESKDNSDGKNNYNSDGKNNYNSRATMVLKQSYTVVEAI